MTYDEALKELEEAREFRDYYYEGWVGIDVAETFLAEVERLRAKHTARHRGAEEEIAAAHHERDEGRAEIARLSDYVRMHHRQAVENLCRAEQAERERDEAVQALRTSRALSEMAQRERDAARALLRECRSWVARGLGDHDLDKARALLAEVADAQCQHGPTADTLMLVVPDALVRRIAAAVGERD